MLYGREEPVAIAITERDLRAALTDEGGLNAVLDVVVDAGKTHSSVLKDFQQDAVRGRSRTSTCRKCASTSRSTRPYR